MTFSTKPTTPHDFDLDTCLAGACEVFGVTPRDLHVIAPARHAPQIQLGAQKYGFTYQLVPAELLVDERAWAISYSPRSQFSREQREDGFGRNMQSQFYWSEGA